MEIEFLEKLEFLFQPARLKIAYGGRGAGKTDGYAIALIVLSMKMRLRILCLREIQSSIEESVKETIESYIVHYGLEGEFDIKDKSITAKRTGSRFIFSGLRYKINSIKSLAKIDIAWIEEANNTSKNSLDKLMPTIRGKHESDPNGLGGPFKMGPEVWISFNPELDDDEVYDRYVVNKAINAPDFLPNEVTGEMERYAYVVKVNYSDNKWFPPDLRREMNLLKANNYTKYLEVWEGFTKQTLDGAIYADEIRQTLLDGRRRHVPYDPTKPVVTAWDLGHADKTAIWFIQRAGVEYNIINYYENRLKKIPHYIEYMQSLRYNYSVIYQPHDADNETLAARSIASMTRKAFPNAKVIVVAKPAKKVVGINAARTIFELCNFDEKNTADGWQCLTRYAFKVDPDTGNFSREPDHDTPWSHGCFTGDTKVLTRNGLESISSLPKIGEVLTQWGWKTYVNPCLTRKNASLVEVHFVNGYTVKCTPDHLFLTENGWKSAESLMKGMLIQSGLTKQHNSSIIKSIEFMKASTILRLMDRCIDTFGQMRLDLFQKVATFTIRMKINPIAPLKILSVCLGRNTYSLAGNYFTGNEADQRLVAKQGKKHLNGINQKKVELGIEKARQSKSWANITEEVFSIALSALHHLKLPLSKSGLDNIVVSNVDTYCSKGKETLQANGKLGTARNVKRNLQILKFAAETIKNIAPKYVGKLIIKEVKRLNEYQDVYCLTVPDGGHFALANGAIVKNCDAWQTFALSLRTEADTNKKKAKPVTLKNMNQPRGWMGHL